jgi:hypothetical protein
MAKKINIEVPIDFDGVALILDKSSYLAVDDYIKRGQMPLCISYHCVPDNGISSTRQVYQNKFNGTLTFVRKNDKISVSAHGFYIWDWVGPDDFKLPAKLMITGVYDKDVTTHYFNAKEEEIDSGVVVEVPVPKTPAKKAKAPTKKA